MTLHKTDGFDVNKNTRPMKIMSSLLMIRAKRLASLVQLLTINETQMVGRPLVGRT